MTQPNWEGCVRASNRLADMVCLMYHPKDQKARDVWPTATWAEIIAAELGIEVPDTDTEIKTFAGQALHIEGRRWFQRTFGNTYHSVRIWINGEQVVCLPFQYGYGEQFLQTALDWLREQGKIPDVCQCCDKARAGHNDAAHGFLPHYGTQYLREQLGGTYSVIDVERKKDL